MLYYNVDSFVFFWKTHSNIHKHIKNTHRHTKLYTERYTQRHNTDSHSKRYIETQTHRKMDTWAHTQSCTHLKMTIAVLLGHTFISTFFPIFGNYMEGEWDRIYFLFLNIGMNNLCCSRNCWKYFIRSGQ